MPAPRNPYTWAPIMRKGGAHVRSRSGQRFNANQSLQDEIDDYFSERNVIEPEQKSVTDNYSKDN